MLTTLAQAGCLTILAATTGAYYVTCVHPRHGKNRAYYHNNRGLYHWNTTTTVPGIATNTLIRDERRHTTRHLATNLLGTLTRTLLTASEFAAILVAWWTLPHPTAWVSITTLFLLLVALVATDPNAYRLPARITGTGPPDT